MCHFPHVECALWSRGISASELNRSGPLRDGGIAARCVQELEAGPVYLKRPLPLYGTAEEILIRADALVEEMIIEMIKNPCEPEPQSGEITFSKRPKPEDGDWAEASSFREIFERIRMLDAEGYPLAFLRIGP